MQRSEAFFPFASHRAPLFHSQQLNARLAALQHQHESDVKYIKTLRDELTAVATKTSSEDGTEQQQIASLKDQLARLQHEQYVESLPCYIDRFLFSHSMNSEIQLSNMQAKHEAALKTVAVSANLAVQSTREKDAKADQLQKELVSANQKLQETRLQKEHSDKVPTVVLMSFSGTQCAFYIRRTSKQSGSRSSVTCALQNRSNISRLSNSRG